MSLSRQEFRLKQRRRARRRVFALLIMFAGIIWGFYNLYRQVTTVTITVPYISQQGLLPTGCEIISSMMVLEYYGKIVSTDSFIANMEIGEIKTLENGEMVAPHLDEAFIGDPNLSSGYGCFPPVIVRTMNKMLPFSHKAVDTTGTTLEELAKNIKSDTPVLVWSTIDLAPIGKGAEWTIVSTGKAFVWPKGEHCIVLVGYDNDAYYFNDPYNSYGTVRRLKEPAEAAFLALGLRSVVVAEK